MAILTIGDLRSRAVRQTARYSKAASAVLKEQVSASPSQQFDIFLSHSYRDAKLNAELMLALRDELREMGYSVYVDWLVDSQLHRENVNKETARKLRNRMDHSGCLFFATSENSPSSAWMPWELGYMDGKKDRVAILPVLSQRRSEYKGQEYLGMYPYVDKAPSSGGAGTFWINESDDVYVSFDAWLEGLKPRKH